MNLDEMLKIAKPLLVTSDYRTASLNDKEFFEELRGKKKPSALDYITGKIHDYDVPDLSVYYGPGSTSSTVSTSASTPTLEDMKKAKDAIEKELAERREAKATPPSKPKVDLCDKPIEVSEEAGSW